MKLVAMYARWILCMLLWMSSAHALVDTSHVGWDQRLGSQLPANLNFIDDANRKVAIGEYFDGAPMVIVFVYFSCPELCPEVLRGVTETLRNTGLHAERDYQLIAVSIDPHDTPERAAEYKSEMTSVRTGPLGAHLLTTSTSASATLARAAGFRYAYDVEHGQFAHAAGFLITDTHGRISKYFFGVRFPADEVRTAIVDAGRGRIAALADRLLLICYHFDPTQGRYTLAIVNVLRVLGVVMLLAAAFVGWRFASAARIKR